MNPKSAQMAPLGAQGGVWGGQGTPKMPLCRFGGRFGVQNDLKMSKNDTNMTSNLPNMTPRDPQYEPHKHRNCSLDSPGGISVCLANIFASVPLSIPKARRHVARFSLPCRQSPSSSSSSYAGYSATKCFTRLLGLLGEHLRIRASKHPNGRGG